MSSLYFSLCFSMRIIYSILSPVIDFTLWYNSVFALRSSHLEVISGKAVLKICSKFTGEHPCQSVISIICCMFSEHLFLRTPQDGWFCTMKFHGIANWLRRYYLEFQNKIKKQSQIWHEKYSSHILLPG